MTKTKSLLTILLVIIYSVSNAQINDIAVKSIDSMVNNWNRAKAPGGAIGIMQNGKIIYTNSFGLASIDYNIPNRDTTLFNIASISKQFTSLGIIKLHLEGKLSIDDDIRKYLPFVPDFGNKITIRHLMHHTSGLRDLHSILTLAGWRENDPRSNKDLIRVMKNQRDLNFKPGDMYLYSNTNYIFMALIIEYITDEVFEQWMKREIFNPLGLHNTYVEANSTDVVPNNATSYNQKKDNSYSRSVEYWNYTGSGNIHTNVYDLLRWQNNYIKPTPGWEKAFDMIQTTDLLNNGDYLDYAFGVRIDSINNIKRVSHGGSIGGFRSFACTFPDKNISIVLLTNFSRGNPRGKLNRVAEIIIPELKEIADKEVLFNNKKTAKIRNIKKFEGDYWFDKAYSWRKIYVKNDTLWYHRKMGNESPLRYIGNSEFIIMPKAKWRVKFITDKRVVKSMIVKSNRFTNIFKPFTPVDISPEYIKEYTGRYYSPELDTYYTITSEDDTLMGHHPRHGDFLIEALAKRDKFISNSPLKEILFIRDSNNNIIGMRVSYSRVKNLWLKKVSKVDFNIL